MLTPWGDLLQVWRVKEKRLVREERLGVAHEVDDTYKVPWETDFYLYKVDIDKQDSVKLTGIGDHALFLGRNSAVCLPTKEFPKLSPDSAYFIDCSDEEKYATKRGSYREMCIWEFKTDQMLRDLGEQQSQSPWLDEPAPIWVAPSIH